MKKNEFLQGELWILAWNASVQHASLYKPGAWKHRRQEIGTFRKELLKFICRTLIPEYSQPVSESDHCNNIDRLITYANDTDNDIRVLGEDGYRYGIAQKLFNLGLKYYWCLGQVKEPPHCPVDRMVVELTPFRGTRNWTEVKAKSDYLEIIGAIRKLAEEAKCTIAVWELNNFKRREP